MIQRYQITDEARGLRVLGNEQPMGVKMLNSCGVTVFFDEGVYSVLWEFKGIETRSPYGFLEQRVRCSSL